MQLKRTRDADEIPLSWGRNTHGIVRLGNTVRRASLSFIEGFAPPHNGFGLSEASVNRRPQPA